jgi:hypothetical protein
MIALAVNRKSKSKLDHVPSDEGHQIVDQSVNLLVRSMKDSASRPGTADKKSTDLFHVSDDTCIPTFWVLRFFFLSFAKVRRCHQYHERERAQCWNPCASGKEPYLTL